MNNKLIICFISIGLYCMYRGLQQGVLCSRTCPLLDKKRGQRIQGSGGQWSVLLFAAVRGAESRLQPTL